MRQRKMPWAFLLDVAFVNSYILQLNAPQLSWKRVTSQREWREFIYNELFNAYGQESRARQRYRQGDERDLQNAELQREHVNREVNHVNRNVKSDCLSCQGFRQGQTRSQSQKRPPLTTVSNNERKRKRSRLRKQSWYGCRICDVTICNNKRCWDLYHHLI